MKPSYRYCGLGLNWDTPFVCPELVAGGQDQEADVVVRIGLIPFVRLPNGDPVQFAFSAEKVIVDVPIIGRFQVENGNTITIQPNKTINHETRLVLFGTVAAFLLRQRGLFAMHASSIATPNGAVLFAGHSGAGKSTLMAALNTRNYAMISDDITVIHPDAAQSTVLPGFPNMKLWANSMNALGHSSVGLKTVRKHLANKYSVPIDGKVLRSNMPLYAVYILEPTTQLAVSLFPLSHAQKFRHLASHAWHPQTVQEQGHHLTHFYQSSTIARRTRIVRVFRPNNLSQLNRYVDVIEQDFLQ